MAGLTGFSRTRRGTSHWTLPAPIFSGVDTTPLFTRNQALQLALRSQQHPHRSFWGDVQHAGSAIGHPIGWAFDKLMRPNYAIAGAVDAAVQHRSIGHAALRGLEGKDHKTFSNVLKDSGVLTHHNFLRGVAGLGLDIATDPLTYLTLGTSAIPKGALEGSAKAVFAIAAKDVSRAEAMKAAKELVPHVEALKAGGKAFEHRAAYGQQRIAGLMHFAKSGKDLTPAFHSELNVARNLAAAEEAQNTARGLHLQAFGKKTAPLPVRLPSMEKIAAAHIPIASKTVDRVGRYFVPQYGGRIEHAVKMSKTHQAERLTSDYLNYFRHTFEKLPGLSEKEQINALHHFERPGGVIKKDGKYVLNPARIAEARKAGLTDNQLKFVAGMHHMGEFLAQQHRSFGVAFKHMGEEGKIYVPHVVAQDGTPLTDISASLLTPRGFQKNRKGEFTIKQLETLRKAGRIPGKVITNPYELMARAARASAHKHADQTVLNYLTKAVGSPTHFVDKAKLTANQQRAAEVQALIASHPERLQKTLDHHDALVEKHLGGPDPMQRTTMATVARIQARRKGARLAAEQQLTDLNAEAKSLAAEAKKLTKGRKIPYKESGRKTVQGIKDEFGHPLHFDPEVASAIEKVKKVMSGDDATLQEFSTGYRKALGKWKLAVTSVNPGYGVRNTLSDYWNMWLAGVPAWAMATYSGKAAHLMAQAKNGKNIKAVREIIDAYDHGVLSGLFPGDVQLVTHMLEHSGSKKALLSDHRYLKLTSKIMQDANRNRENWGRLTHYLYRRQHQGLDQVHAAQWVKKAHFDYEDLTDFEKRVMKSAAPFYTWARKNIPYQIERMFMAPGRYSAFPKTAAEMTQAAGGDVPSVPDYLNKNMAFRVPFMGGGYMLPMIGVTDLNKADPRNWKDTVGQMANPAAKTLFELAANRSLFTGQDIKDPAGHPRTPIGGLAADVLSMIPGTNVGKTSRQGVSSMGADPRAVYLLRQLGPLAGFGLQAGNPVTTSQQGKWKAPLAYLSGVNVSKVNPKTQALFDELNFQNTLKGKMKGLRDEGKLPQPKKRKKSRQQQILEQTLQNAIAGRR